MSVDNKTRTGSLAVPRAHVEVLPDGSEVKLGVFLSNTKSRRGKLTDNKLQALHVTEDLHGLLGDRRGNPEIDLLKLGPRFEPDHKVVIRTGHTATLLY
ncbi:hypothetical protein [Streptomyces celluloflavus]|uniref:hypothetical protein n=1 Tax=Streptomyces celluloflavus TaxID=58344 RepID=UPI00369C9DA5